MYQDMKRKLMNDLVDQVKTYLINSGFTPEYQNDKYFELRPFNLKRTNPFMNNMKKVVASLLFAKDYISIVFEYEDHSRVTSYEGPIENVSQFATVWQLITT